MLIGITGGIGSGKTTICKELEKQGYPVYYADTEAKRIISEDDSIRSAIIHLLGENAYCGKQYQTRYVASRVFAEPKLLEQLNTIVHPSVEQDLQTWAKGRDLCFVESAILFESQLDRQCYATVAVLADAQLRLQRTLQRDYSNRADAANIVEKRMNAQLSNKEFKKRSTYTLLNDGSSSIEHLAQQLIERVRQV